MPTESVEAEFETSHGLTQRLHTMMSPEDWRAYCHCDDQKLSPDSASSKTLLDLHTILTVPQDYHPRGGRNGAFINFGGLGHL
jgi:hypothetical protein